MGERPASCLRRGNWCVTNSCKQLFFHLRRQERHCPRTSVERQAVMQRRTRQGRPNFQSASVMHFQMLSPTTFTRMSRFLRRLRHSQRQTLCVVLKVRDEMRRYATGLDLGPVFGRKALTDTTNFASALVKALKRV